MLFHLFEDSSIPIIDKGDLGVDVFFMLSGFILAHVYSESWANHRTSYISFIKSRLARIYPLHLFALSLLALLVIVLPGFAERYPEPGRWGAEGFVASLLLIQNWGYFLPSCWNSPAWSLSAEWFAYLGFPFVLKATQWPRSTVFPLICAAVSLLTLCIVLMLWGVYSPARIGKIGMLRMGCEFTAGCFLFRAVANGLAGLPRTGEMAVLGLFFVAAIVPGAEFVCLFACGLIILTAQGEGWISQFLATHFIVFLGKISYSLYLLHWIVIQVSNWLLDGPVALPAGSKLFWDVGLILFCICLATLSYNYLEVPARVWGRGVGGERSPLVGGERPPLRKEAA
jgi:peptidoglycan/LPS O-acetylase OafA/YrhL